MTLDRGLRYSHGFHLFPVLARIHQFSGAHTDSTIFLYWSGQFFCTRTDSTFCRQLLGFNNFVVLTLILPFFVLVRTVVRHSHGFHLLLVVARIQQFSGDHTESTIFRYWSGQFFGTRTDSTFSRYLPRFYHFSVLTRILPFFGTRPDSVSVLARIVPFVGTRPDSTIFWYSH